MRIRVFGEALSLIRGLRTLGWLTLGLLTTLGSPLSAQQTLGSINGTVTDVSGAVIPGSQVKARATATNLEVSATSASDGSFNIADLPIGEYEVSFLKDGFEKSVHPHILVQGNRTTTINARLHPGSTSESVTVQATPLLNQTDTTTGYTLSEVQVTDMPLGTGSFTQLAILSPGVSADFLNTAGTNAGLGNQAIWANGQRDTSNSFTLNGVSGNNLFNGKSTSQVTSGRVAVNIGEGGNGNNPSGEIVTSTSVYGAIGEALPSPPPETVQEMNVNSSMYDASQGSYSGAHIELTTKSGTNAIHGGVYDYYETSKWNANEWFFNFNSLARPPMHRETYGAYVGGPLIKDKLFYFGSYQGVRAEDQLLATSLVPVPPDLTSDRSPGTNTPAGGGLAAVVDKDFIGDLQCGTGGTHPACFDPTTITPQALAIMQQKAPDGSFFVPNAATGNQLQNLETQGDEAAVQGGNSVFRADQVNGNIDYFFSARDRLAAKYYFQNDPNTTPFANSQLLGFPQTMHAGSQTFSLDNTTSLTPNLTWEQKLGFIRQRANSQQSQFISPSSIQMNLLGHSLFPSMSLHNADGSFDGLSVGPSSNFANTGWFQNNWEGTTNLQWVRGQHNLSTGFNFEYSQMNIINRNDQLATVNFEDFPGFLQGQVCSPTFPCNGQSPSEVLTGNTSRHYRTKQAGAYVQDKWRIRPNLTVDVGVRWDWDGPLVEANGLMSNFYPQNYSYNVATDTIENIGLVIAGNNKAFGTKGVSNSTLTGRQWGFAPRIGLAYSPSFVKNIVVRAGFGMYYDRGEYFTEFSPPAGGGISGPFGVTVEEPFVVPFFAVPNATFAVPFGTSAPPPPPTNFSTIQTLVPNASNLINQTTPYCTTNALSGCGPLLFGGYDPRNTLPYSENWTLDVQWQPRNDLVLTMGYVGNHGVHETIPLPFNQAQIATQANPLLKGGPFQQNFSYGFNMNCFPIFPCTASALQAGPLVLAAENINAFVQGVGTGNAALRAPFIGYDPNSDFNRTVGESNYNALQFGVNKRLSRGLLITGSYTFSHTLDEQSGLGLFFNGNDPNNPHSSYGKSDFDRTHVFTVSYHYDFPTMSAAHGWVKYVVNGWGLNGLTVLQSGQPYSVIDFSGGVAGIYWGGGQDTISNPIVPIGGVGATSTKATLQGTTGINGQKPILNPAAFGPVPALAPSTPGNPTAVPACDSSSGTPVCDTFENGYATGQRNIFRGPFQNRWDFGAAKDFRITERLDLRYDINAFNIFNHPSFDIPNNNVDFNAFCNPPGPTFSCSSEGYAFPPIGHLGELSHTIGSPRFIQMALHLSF